MLHVTPGAAGEPFQKHFASWDWAFILFAAVNSQFIDKCSTGQQSELMWHDKWKEVCQKSKIQSDWVVICDCAHLIGQNKTIQVVQYCYC